MQGLSSRAHAFSVEALVGKSMCKRLKVEHGKEEDPNDTENRNQQDQSTCTVISEEEDSDNQTEKKRKGGFILRNSKETESETEVRVELQGSDLWNRFHEIGTEMIITKAGRRMFPSVRVKVRNLDPFKQYYIAMDIMPVDSKRYRYVYHSSQWMVAGNTDHSCIAPRLYIHPDSPCSGETWMRQVISFDRVKLTNNEMDDKGHIILQSMHKYKPRVHVILHDPRLDLSQIPSLPDEGVHSFSFSETQFTTVTAYQNQQITKLKIDRNPFAKGFRDPGRNRGVLDGILESYPWRSPLSLDFKPFALETQGGTSRSLSSCSSISPLKDLLSPSCSPTSFPFTIPYSDAGALHNVTFPLCYKIPSSAAVLGGRPYSLPVADRLRGYPGLRPMVDFPLLCPLHGKKGPNCRGPCLQGPLSGPPGQLSLSGLQGTGGSIVHQSPMHHETLPPPLPSAYSVCGYSIPVGHRFSGVARHLKLADGVNLAASESLLSQTPWHPAINHCL
ncbi:T-box transcription factor TBX22 [Anguilla rostrata]|uniref:T-box transcription factor TBX22 n=1 Tax=Anguilla rostrata TaxID=7938 RepID=UPI0030D24239